MDNCLLHNELKINMQYIYLKYFNHEIDYFYDVFIQYYYIVIQESIMCDSHLFKQVKFDISSKNTLKSTC